MSTNAGTYDFSKQLVQQSPMTRRDILIQQVQEDLGLTEFAEEHDLTEEAQQQLCDAVVNLLEREIENQEDMRREVADGR